MKKQADFRQAKMHRDLWFSQHCSTIRKASRIDVHELIELFFALEQRQYIRIKDHARRMRLEKDYYELFWALGEENGGRVELDIDEEYYYGTLTYCGDSLLIDNTFTPGIKQMSEIIADSDTISISAADNCFKLQLSFDMNKREIITPRFPQLL